MNAQNNVPLTSEWKTDANGNPTGGKTTGIGLAIEWQEGIMSVGKNGAFVEDTIQASIDRLNFFNSTKFRCRENSLAITKLEEALHWLNHRTQLRLAQGVEDSYETHQD